MKKINLQILIHVVFRSSVLPTEKEWYDFKTSESSTYPTTNDFAMFTTAKVILTEDNTHFSCWHNDNCINAILSLNFWSVTL